MSKLKQPLRLWHGLLAVVAALAVGAASTAIAGGGGNSSAKNLTTAGFGPGGFVHDGKYYYGVKTKTAGGTSQERVRIKCPRRSKVVGGGGGGLSNISDEQAVNFTGPYDSRDRGRVPEDGWAVWVDTLAPDNRGIAAWAVCIKKKR